MRIDSTWSRHCKTVLLSAFLADCAISTSQALAQDPLIDGFHTPPSSAAPLVWWHWMNGNISEPGIQLDLEWMKHIGIGGAQLFEGDLGTPRVVEHPLSYMSPPWQHALKTAVATAEHLGLELTIASSPGWSSAGGPWVTPADGMKKLVWSELRIAGGNHFVGRLPRPPDIAGPFQQIPKAAVQAGAPSELPHFYRDSALLAFRDTTRPLGTPDSASVDGGLVDAQALNDDDFQTGIDVPVERPSLEYRFNTPRRVRAVTIGLPGLQGFGAPPPPVASLEVSNDGEHFRPVVTLPSTPCPVRSASFPEVTAKVFRIVFAPFQGKTFLDGLPTAAGAVLPVTAQPQKSLRVTEFELFADARVHAFPEKSGFGAAEDYYALQTPSTAVQRPVRLGGVINLTKQLKDDGTIDWTAPSGGVWRLIRFGYSLTGQRNGPAPMEATGLEVDKLNRAAVARYIDHYLGLYDTALEGRSAALDSLLTDSIESGPQNWTEDFLGEFARRRGYDPTRWLPVLTGIVIESAADSDRFLWDFRKTLSELLASNYYGQLASAAHRRGWKYYAEALEDHRPQLGDDMAMRSAADVPMGAMWMFNSGGQPRPTYVADLQGATSVAHVYGKPVIAAESLTAFGQPWGFSPRDLKHVADLEFSLGVNRIAIHESTHQPFVDRKPGMALSPFLGQYFNRNETWAPMASAWVAYLARTSFLLQQGKPHTDVAYFYGEEAPLTGLFGDKFVADVPEGLAFDFIGPDALADCLSARPEGLVSCGGGLYQILYLGGTSEHMSLPVLRKLSELVSAGATLVGQRPIDSPSLADDRTAFHLLVESLFGVQSEQRQLRNFGSGRVIEADLAAAVKLLGVGADWRFFPDSHGLRVVHRELPGGHLFFVSNQAGRPLTANFEAKVSGGLRPELWSAETGTSEPVAFTADEQHTRIALTLKTDDAVFIVLRSSNTTFGQPPPQLSVAQTVDAPWYLDIPGTPSTKLTKLVSWTDLPADEQRHFSGIGRYRTRVEVPPEWVHHNNEIFLDLGTVDDLATVSVNGQPAGVTWHPPYVLDVSTLLRVGWNDITVEVANLWINRLIGDARNEGSPQTFTTGPTYKADAPLRTSGLRGPVRFLMRPGRKN